MQKKCEVLRAAPILNTEDFSFAFGGLDGKTIPLDSRGLPFCFEFVALPGMQFEMKRLCSEWIAEVSFPTYPKKELFLDTRFTTLAQKKEPTLFPSQDLLLSRMEAMLGKPYVWGGNWHEGIDELFSLYPPKGPLDAKTETLWALRGVDCSGLLYEATRGLTPRNTSELKFFGKSLKINGLSTNEILEKVLPLDMVITQGHVFFVFDRKTSIESRFPLGVVCRDLKERFEELLFQKEGVDQWDDLLHPEKQFIIRRFV